MAAASFKLTIWVPVEQVGIVIGRNGAQINRIQSGSSTRVNVAPEASAWAPVVIKGAPEGAFSAAKQVEELVEEVDDAVAEFQVGAKARGLLRGEGSEDLLLSDTTKRISAECAVRIRVPAPRTNGKDEEPVTLEGAPSDVRRALGMVVSAGQGLDPFGGKPNVVERVVAVPARRLRLVARRGQQQPAYRMIARCSGATVVKLPKETDSSSETDDERKDVKDSSVLFAVRGQEASVDAACDALNAVLEGESVKETVANLRKEFSRASSSSSSKQQQQQHQKAPPAGAQQKQQPPTQKPARRSRNNGGKRPASAKKEASSKDVASVSSKDVAAAAAAKDLSSSKGGASPSTAKETNKPPPPLPPQASSKAPAPAAAAPAAAAAAPASAVASEKRRRSRGRRRPSANDAAPASTKQQQQ
ncbi:hypothetical protein CTAYLR_004104 [Chrysophaeum taylorii]|uniref:K Homology domain-containing protein n=1 Tax=Chrysophaeum taylorii TaxID=2483200 RepID=A0AAD7UF01_9STRA|nr:hypothetical protein CTAYLR_004104 [Chrysophaeum taylorii]